jgi:hypothetical protein
MAKLSVAECRKYLDGIDLSDKQVEMIRDSLTMIANAVFNERMSKWKK